MPISLNEFQKGNIIDGSSKIVRDFLSSHRDQAFTQDEIIKGVNPNPTTESFVHFLAAKAPLHLQGIGERREISTPNGPELYYLATGKVRWQN
jgi:hypothetical protein